MQHIKCSSCYSHPPIAPHKKIIPNSLIPHTHHKWRIILLFFFLPLFFNPMSSPSNIPSPPTTTNHHTNHLTNLGLGYSIAFALTFLILLSTLIFSSYLCCRANRNRNRDHNHNSNTTNNNNNSTNDTSNNDGIVLPRVIFVAEDEDEQTVAVGLDENVINSYPRFLFCRDAAGQNTTCSICLCEYKDSEMLRMMPECRHYFHLCCLDSWLKLNGSCPVCRNSPMPTPVSTPLSTPLQEVVPLSQYAADRRRR